MGLANLIHRILWGPQPESNNNENQTSQSVSIEKRERQTNPIPSGWKIKSQERRSFTLANGTERTETIIELQKVPNKPSVRFSDKDEVITFQPLSGEGTSKQSKNVPRKEFVYKSNTVPWRKAPLHTLDRNVVSFSLHETEQETISARGQYRWVKKRPASENTDGLNMSNSRERSLSWGELSTEYEFAGPATSHKSLDGDQPGGSSHSPNNQELAANHSPARNSETRHDNDGSKDSPVIYYVPETPHAYSPVRQNADGDGSGASQDNESNTEGSEGSGELRYVSETPPETQSTQQNENSQSNEPPVRKVSAGASAEEIFARDLTSPAPAAASQPQRPQFFMKATSAPSTRASEPPRPAASSIRSRRHQSEIRSQPSNASVHNSRSNITELPEQRSNLTPNTSISNRGNEANTASGNELPSMQAEASRTRRTATPSGAQAVETLSAPNTRANARTERRRIIRSETPSESIRRSNRTPKPKSLADGFVPLTSTTRKRVQSSRSQSENPEKSEEETRRPVATASTLKKTSTKDQSKKRKKPVDTTYKPGDDVEEEEEPSPTPSPIEENPESGRKSKKRKTHVDKTYRPKQEEVDAEEDSSPAPSPVKATPKSKTKPQKRKRPTGKSLKPIQENEEDEGHISRTKTCSPKRRRTTTEGSHVSGEETDSITSEDIIRVKSPNYGDIQYRSDTESSRDIPVESIEYDVRPPRKRRPLPKKNRGMGWGPPPPKTQRSVAGRRTVENPPDSSLSFTSLLNDTEGEEGKEEGKDRKRTASTVQDEEGDDGKKKANTESRPTKKRIASKTARRQ